MGKTKKCNELLCYQEKVFFHESAYVSCRPEMNSMWLLLMLYITYVASFKLEKKYTSLQLISSLSLALLI